MGGLRLDARQLAVLARIGPALPSSYFLAGGVAVAAHLGHRASRDLDLFGASDPNELLPALQELPGVDLACMKLAAIAGRGAARDFWDLHSIIAATGSSIGELLEAFRAKFVAVDIGHVVRSLVYFGDAELEPFPVGLSLEHWAEVKRDLESWVLALAD